MPVRVQISLPRTSGLPEDVVVNTWHLNATEGQLNEEGVGEAFADFYQTIGQWISGQISRATQTVIEMYNLSDPEPRVPFASGGFSLPATSENASLPAEVALVNSFQAPASSGSPQARRRGRVFLGPFNADVVATAGTSDGRPAGALVDAVVGGTNILAQALAAANAPLGVYSRVDGVVRTVSNGWVDNAFDTQRRRGGRPTTRTTWSLE